MVPRNPYSFHMCIILVVFEIGIVKAGPDYLGQNFLLVFPDLGWEEGSRPLPGATYRAPNRGTTVIAGAPDKYINDINSGSQTIQTYTMDDYLAEGSKQTKAIPVRSDNGQSGDKIPGITCMVHSGHLSYLSLPNRWLGTDYRLTCPAKVSIYDNITCIVAIAALRANTKLTLILKQNYSESEIALPSPISSDGNNAMLAERESIQINFNDDLGILKVVATKDVSVVSGAKMTSSLSGYASGHVVSQRLPTSFWGKMFVVALPVLKGAFVHLDVVGKGNDSTVMVSNGTHTEEMDVNDAGHGSLGFECEDNCVVQVESTEPISLTYYLLPTPTRPHFLSTMVVVTPVERYNSKYDFTVDVESTTTSLKGVIVARLDLNKGGFRINESPVVCEGSPSETVTSGDAASASKWTQFGNSFNLCWLPLTEGQQLKIKHVAGERTSFGLFVYRITANSTLDYPMNMRLVKLWDACDVDNNATTPVIGNDGLDNDCDGRVDEELKNDLDDDGDGQVDEDVSNDDPSGHVIATDAPGNAGNNSDDGNSTVAPPPKTDKPGTSVKPTRPTYDLTKTYIVCGSVFIGVPLIVLLALAIEACVMTCKDGKKSVWKKPGRPEVIPIVNLPADDVDGPAYYQEPSEEEKRNTPSELIQNESSC